MSDVSIPPPGSASPAATRRLQKDYAKLAQDPVEGITALPNENNILEWHYCLRGSPDTPYAGGYYWGKIIFKPDFPWSPPAIMMITPNGRFTPNVRLCLSISDYHPESWNPGWTVSAILIGLHSFMNDNANASGVMSDSDHNRRALAASSMIYNMKSAEFVSFFPGLVSEWQKSAGAQQPGTSNVVEVKKKKVEAVVRKEPVKVEPVRVLRSAAKKPAEEHFDQQPLRKRQRKVANGTKESETVVLD